MRTVKSVTALAASGLLVLAGCSNGSDEGGQAAASPVNSASAAVPSAPSTITSVKLSEPIDHIHGLVATGRSQLVAGTHAGAVAVSDVGEVSTQGSQRDDLMGMTGEAGTGKLASSGHPGPGSGYLNPMGLITSSNTGKTWTPVSLQGEVDFHALAISGDNVIGYGGGATLAISADGGETWNPGAALPVAALAYSGDRVLATTQAGLQASTDGGETFDEVPDAPLLALISAGTDQAVLGLDPDGVAWRSSDSGRTWVEVGEVGQVQAIAAYDSTIGYAIDEDRLVVIE